MKIEQVGRLTGLPLEQMRGWAKGVMSSRTPDQRLEDGQKGIYLERWYAIPQNPAGGVYVHRIMRNDKDVMHDHPWDHTSLIVAGEYQEETPDGIWNRPTGAIIRRPAELPHRLLLPAHGRECISVVFTGLRSRDWGFHCPKGWVHWREFTDPADEGIVGRGCGEMA